MAKSGFALMSLLLVAFLVSGCGGGATPPAPAQGSVEGYVYDLTTNTGVSGATVTITGYTGSVTTQATGYFKINGIPPGSQTLSIIVGGYASASAEVTVRASQTLSLGRRYIAAAGTNALVGRVVENGATPDRPVTVTLTNYTQGNALSTIQTDAAGYYVVTPDLDPYAVGDELLIEVAIADSYDDATRDARGLATHTSINWFYAASGLETLPTLDVYAYGMSLQNPADNATVTLPANVLINPYSRHAALGGHYYLYFWGDLGSGDQYVDDTEYWWTTNTFSFDGLLDDGTYIDSLAQSCWYPAYTYDDGAYSIDVNNLGHWVNHTGGIHSARVGSPATGTNRPRAGRDLRRTTSQTR